MEIERYEADFKRLYFHLFNAITDALDDLERGDMVSASVRLAAAQYFTEDAYISGDE